MKIAYLVGARGVPVRGPSGASAHVRGLATGLQQAGHDVHVWAPLLVDRRGAHGDPVPATATGAPGWPSWLDKIRDLSEIWTSRRLSRAVIERAYAEGPPDRLIERHALWSDAGWRVGAALDLPWTLEVNAPLALERGRYEELRLPAFAHRWERDVLRAAPEIVAVSEWLVQWLVQEVGCASVRRVWNGVSGLVGDRAAGRARLGVEDGPRIIGFVGSMKPWHGVERLARVADALGARLALIGPSPADAPAGAILTGPLAPQALADAVAALDLGFAPYPADAPPWFCPLKILDYRAQGTPVIATDTGESRALTGEGGAVVPPGDDDALIDAARLWIGRRAAPWVRSWRVVAEEVLAGPSTQGSPAPARAIS